MAGPGITPENNTTRRDFIKGAVVLTAATTLPSVALAGITDTTRQKVEALRKDFPNFKLSPEAQQCLDEKILDPECDPTINDEIAIYRDKQQLNSDKQQLNSDKQQLNSDKQQLNSDKQQLDVIKTARQNIEIVIGLIQLGMYVDYGKVPNTQADYIKLVQSNPNTPKEIQQLFTDILHRHKAGLPLNYNPYGKQLLDYAKSYLDASIALQQKISDTKFKNGMNEFTQNARTMFSGYVNAKSTQKSAG